LDETERLYIDANHTIKVASMQDFIVVTYLQLAIL